MLISVIVLLAAGLLFVVLLAMARTSRGEHSLPEKDVRASSGDGGGYEPASLFGSGPWPMETPLDRREPEAASRPSAREAKAAAAAERAQSREERQERSAATSGAPGTDVDVWATPPRRSLLRRRQKDDLLSPVFRRRTEEPKLVVRLEKPQPAEPPTEPEALPTAAPAPPVRATTQEAGAEPSEAAAGADTSATNGAAQPRRPRPVRRAPAKAAKAAAESPRIIHLVDSEDEAEAEAPQQVPERDQQAVQAEAAAEAADMEAEAPPAGIEIEQEVAQEPEIQPAIDGFVTATQEDASAQEDADAAAEIETGPLADALGRAQMGAPGDLDRPKAARSASALSPPGALPDPLPFIRGIGRTRAREEALPSLPALPSTPPPVLHIQTIYLDEHGDPVIVTEEEAAEAEHRKRAEQEAARKRAERAQREAAEREAALRTATEIDLRVEGLDDAEPLAHPFPELAPEPPAQEASFAWEPEPPVGALWTEGAATPAERESDHNEPIAAPAAVTDTEETAPPEEPPVTETAASTAIVLEEVPARGPGEAGEADRPERAQRGDERVERGEESQPGEPSEPPAPAPRRVSRPAAIGSRPDRKPPTGPDSDRPRTRRPAPGPRREGPPRTPGTPGTAETPAAPGSGGTVGAGIVPLSTGSAVRPHVTVNLTEEDIQGSDELYEVNALLHAITRDPSKQRKKRTAAQAGDAGRAGRAGSPTATPPAPATGRAPFEQPGAAPQRRAPQEPGPSRPATQPGVSIPLGSKALPPRPNPWVAEAARTEQRAESRIEGRVDRPVRRRSEPHDDRRPTPRPEVRSSQPGQTEEQPGPVRTPAPDPRRSASEARPAEPDAPAKPPARRKAARPVTLILVDEEGRPQLD